MESETITQNGHINVNLVEEETIILQCRFKMANFVKRVPASKITESQKDEEKLDPSILHVSQDIINRKEVADLSRNKSTHYNWLKSVSFPCEFLQNGMYLVLLSDVNRIEGMLQNYIEIQNRLLDQFELKYDRIVQEGKLKRGNLADDNDYPPFEQIREKYGIETRHIEWGISDKLKQKNQQLYAEEKERQRQDWANTAEMIRDTARQAFLTITQKFVDKLGIDPETGQPKRFDSRNIENLRTFIREFENRNITRDSDLAQLAKAANNLISDLTDVKQISNNEGFRDQLKDNMNIIVAQADQLVEVKRRRRKINFNA